jgi:hypothetical protein
MSGARGVPARCDDEAAIVTGSSAAAVDPEKIFAKRLDRLVK